MGRQRLRRILVVVTPALAGIVLGTVATYFIYRHYARQQYVEGSVRVLRFTREVFKGDQLKPDHVEPFRIPDALKEALQGVVREGDVCVLLRERLNRDRYKGSFLFYEDVAPIPGPEPPPPGYARIPVPTHPNDLMGRSLEMEPASYSLYADFDVDPDPETLRIEVLQVVSNAKNYTPACNTYAPEGRITLTLREEAVADLLTIQQYVASRRFFVVMQAERKGMEMRRIEEEKEDPVLNREVLRMIREGEIERPYWSRHRKVPWPGHDSILWHARP